MSETLRQLPYGVLVPLAVLLALAPFHPKPHLVEKLQLLLSGDLKRPLDSFDLVFHAAPLALLVAKFVAGR